MEIEELKKLKQHLDDKILTEIRQFEADTNTRVCGIDFHKLDGGENKNGIIINIDTIIGI